MMLQLNLTLVVFLLVAQACISIYEPSMVHVVYAGDGDHLPGLFASMKSVVSSSNYPSLITIHILEYSGIGDVQLEQRVLHHSALLWVASKRTTVKIHSFTYDDVKPFINNRLNKSSRLINPSNYARFLLEEKLANVSKCLYLDTDTIVAKDVVSYINSLSLTKAIAAFPRPKLHVPSRAFKKLSEKGILVADVSHSQSGFNAGILVINLDFWRRERISAKIRSVSLLNNMYNLWNATGSQPPLVVLFGGENFHRLNNSLLLCDLGFKKRRLLKGDELNMKMFFHWNGHLKPWDDSSISLSKPYHYFHIWRYFNGTRNVGLKVVNDIAFN